MTPKQRVLAALRFSEPDRVPRFWQGFWPEFTAGGPMPTVQPNSRRISVPTSAWSPPMKPRGRRAPKGSAATTTR